jgi:hypothetical protein
VVTVATALAWLGAHWGVLFFLWFLGVFSGVRNFVLDTLSVITGHPRPSREIELGDEDEDDEDEDDEPAPAVRAPAPAGPSAPEKKPGPCVHRRVTRIMSVDDELVGWLCTNCDTRLPADWAVREEDL